MFLLVITASQILLVLQILFQYLMLLRIDEQGAVYLGDRFLWEREQRGEYLVELVIRDRGRLVEEVLRDQNVRGELGLSQDSAHHFERLEEA